MKWEQGRHNSGSPKIEVILSPKYLFACYILKYPKGSEIPEHTDPVPKGYEHHRLNIVLWKGTGGQLKIDGKPVNKRIIKFRPDLSPHEVSKVTKGIRYVLSIGWLKRS